MASIISVVIVNWNTLPWIQLYLEGIRQDETETYGLLKITDVKLEVIVVDNASTDGSLEYLTNLEKDGRIKLIANDRNLGYPRGLNQGLALAEGDLLLSSNSDCEVLRPDALSWILRVAQKHPKTLFGQQATYLKDPPCFGYLQGHLIAFWRSFLEDVGWWREDFGLGFYEDVELSWRAMKNGYVPLELRLWPIFHHGARSYLYRDAGAIDFPKLKEKNKALFKDLVARNDYEPRRPKWLSTNGSSPLPAR